MKEKIDKLSRVEMARLIRFGSAEPYFNEENYQYFMERFKSLGGMSPEISKMIGW